MSNGEEAPIHGEGQGTGCAGGTDGSLRPATAVQAVVIPGAERRLLSHPPLRRGCPSIWNRSDHRRNASVFAQCSERS